MAVHESIHPYLLDRANTVFQKLEKYPNFPDSYCTFSAKFFIGGIVDRLYLSMKFGIRAVEGGFKIDTPTIKGSIEIDHNWLVDKNNNYLDLTAFQFNPNLAILLPRSFLVVTPQDPTRGRYTIDRTYNLFDPRSIV